jgi:hypothetical protein
MKRALIFLCLAGCGVPSTGDVDALIQNMANEQCAWQFRCCTDSEIDQLDGRKYKTEQDCKPYRDLELRTELYLHRLAAREGRLRVDSQLASACLAQMQARACNPKPGMTAMPSPMTVDACADVFTGSTPPGDECIYTTECQKGSRCVGDDAAVGRGVCVPFQQEGDICNNDTDCDPKVKNLYCAKADFRCHLRGSFGDPCEYTTDTTGKNPKLPLLLECDTGPGANLYCDPVGKTCKQLPADGDPCLYPLPPGVSAQCNPDPALRLVCDHGTGTTGGGTCRAPAGVGQSCRNLACDEGLYCDSSTFVCKTLPTLGQSCSTSSFRCAEPFFCNTSQSPYVCDEPASIGETCVSPSRTCNTDAYCDTSLTRQCQPRRADGSECDSSVQCLSSLCGFDAVTQTEVCQRQTGAVACSGR